MSIYGSPQDMSKEEKVQIITATLCAYVMYKENLTQPQALIRMAELTTLTQLALLKRKEG